MLPHVLRPRTRIGQPPGLPWLSPGCLERLEAVHTACKRKDVSKGMPSDRQSNRIEKYCVPSSTRAVKLPDGGLA